MDFVSNLSGSDLIANLLNLFASLVEKSIGFLRLTSVGARADLIALF